MYRVGPVFNPFNTVLKAPVGEFYWLDENAKKVHHMYKQNYKKDF
jgi:hypothetical protein